jgi:GST-like protein
MGGQIGHFNVFAPEKVPYAIDRYTREVHRLYDVLDRRLAGREYVAGDYSIADIACYPWIVPYAVLGQKLEEFPNLARWFETIRARPATIRTYADIDEGHAPPRWAAADSVRRASSAAEQTHP